VSTSTTKRTATMPTKPAVTAASGKSRAAAPRGTKPQKASVHVGAANPVSGTVKLPSGGLAELVLEHLRQNPPIVISPCDGVRLPKNARPKVRPPSPDDVAAMADAVGERYRAVVVLLAGSGLRIGEVCGLKVRDVDWLRRNVEVERQRVPSGAIAPVKTEASQRTVPLGAVVLDTLAAHLAAYPSPEWMFLTAIGEPLSYKAWSSVWRRARLTTGLTMETHDLRHYYASLLISGGASVKVVQEQLGHGSAAVTLDTYAGLWPGDDDRSRATADRALDGLRTVCGLASADGGKTAGQRP
jgi:integrase